MIIFIHGTGDDDSKPENWMPAAARIMEQYGEICLVLPGVASGEQSQIVSKSTECLSKVELAWRANGSHNNPTTLAGIAALETALHAAGREVQHVLVRLNASIGDTLEEMNYIGSEQRAEGGLRQGSIGIKPRAALGALCASAYYRYTPADRRRPIRIVGHSRGGSAAVAMHNILTYWGIPCNHTLTLDPCHGATKLGQKTYFHRVWGGSLVNIPAKKGVGIDWASFHVYRPSITVGEGGSASINELDLLRKIKHGHMGKLRSFSGSGKAAGRAALQTAIEPTITTRQRNPNLHLQALLENHANPAAAEADDRLAVWGELISTLNPGGRVTDTVG